MSEIDRLTEAIQKTSDSVSSLQTSLDNQLASLKRELKEDQLEAAEKAAKKARIEGSLQFRSKGNEDQYTFNSRISDILETAAAQLIRVEEIIAASPSTSATISTPTKLNEHVEKAKNAVDEGTKMLTVRQKHIKLADRSEFGWKFVKEYETDDLAEDDQDEKRIAKAEKLAEKKAATTKKKKVFYSQRSSTAAVSTRFNGPWQSHNTAMNRPYGGWALKHKMLHAPFSGVRFPVPPVTRPVGAVENMVTCGVRVQRLLVLRILF